MEVMATTPTTGSHTNTLLAYRQRRNMTQERLAVLSGLSRGWLGFLERNPEAMTATAAAKLATALGVRAEDLLVAGAP